MNRFIEAFKLMGKIGNIRTALEKVYTTIKEGVAVMTYVKESLEADKPSSKYIEDLKNIIKLCTTINTVIAKILFVIGGVVDTSPVVAKTLYTIKANNVINIDKSIQDLKDLVI